MKVAVIGRGFGVYAMKPSFEARGWKVDVIPSRDEAAVAAACTGDADLIAVHSPPFQHRDHVLRAIEAGKDVLCDKPFGIDAGQAREMRDAARDAGVLDFLNFEFRHNPARAKIRELVASGAIGKLQHIACSSITNFMLKRDWGWINDASLGGGWLGAWASHMIDAMRWQTGSEVTDCGGVSRVDVAERPDGAGGTRACTAEDGFSFWLKLSCGASVSVDGAACAPVMQTPRLSVIGSEGVLELTAERSLTLTRGKGEPEVFDFTPAPGASAWAVLEDWIAAIEQARATRTRIAPNFDDGLATAEVLDALKARMVRA